MVWNRKEKAGGALWILAGGIALGLAAAFFLSVRARRKQYAVPSNLRRLEDAVIDALRHDQVLRSRAIEVAAIAPGIIELTGTVESEADGHQAMAVAQGVTGVRTVLNRLDALEAERRLRQRARTSAEANAGSRWYGMNVGMGRRRQSAETDPAQRDDHADLLDQALSPDPDAALADLKQERSEKRATQANEVS